MVLFSAILELKDPVYFSEKIRPICLPERAHLIQYNSHDAKIAGWGGDGQANWVENLKDVDVTLFNNNLCKKNIHIQGQHAWKLDKEFDTISE